MLAPLLRSQHEQGTSQIQVQRNNPEELSAADGKAQSEAKENSVLPVGFGPKAGLAQELGSAVLECRWLGIFAAGENASTAVRL